MMYRLSIITWIFVLFVFDVSFAINDDEYFQYIHPKPGSEYVSCQTSLTIRFHDEWQQYLNANTISIHVRGDISGVHEGRVIRTNDLNTFVFKPFDQFLPNENVHVEVSANLPGFNESIKYYFSTSNNEKTISLMIKDDLNQINEVPINSQEDTFGKMTVINGVAVPSDFPKLNIDILEETAEGKLFLSNTNGSTYLMILENDGTPYFYQRLPGASGDFKVQPTGTITRVGWPRSLGYFEMDSNYQVIDTLACGNGYLTDTHEIQLLLNGNYLVIVLDYQIIDMSQVVEDGKVNATVIGNHIQELDREGNVVFEWRSWDHYNITDAINEDLTANTIDYVHMNAIAVDFDDHLLVSSRNLSEITKINHETGEIIWRLGGENNQFKFIGDQYGISYQHDIRPVPGKENYYTLFDNGNYHDPPFSRAVEFFVDTGNMTATKVWEYRYVPDFYVGSRGSVQRLSNGNTLIDWSGGTLPIVSEVTPQGAIVYKLSFSENLRTYRSFRFEWDGVMEEPYLIVENWPEKVSLIFNKFGDEDISGYVIYGDTIPEPVMAIDTTVNTWIDLTSLENNQNYYFRVTALNRSGEESDFSNQEKVYVRYVEPGDNMILNSDFSENDEHWELETNNGAIASGYVDNSQYHLNIDLAGSDYEDVRLKQNGMVLIKDKHYLLSFDGYSDGAKIIEVKLDKENSPFKNYSRIGFTLLTTNMKHYNYQFEMTHLSDFNASLVLNCGISDADIFIDNILLKEIITSNIQEDDNYIPDKYKLQKNYPNPFNPKTIINYELPMTNYVELNIYNLLGQKVITLVSEKQKAGHYQVEWDASGYASGVYYYQLSTSEGFIQTKKLILLR